MREAAQVKQVNGVRFRGTGKSFSVGEAGVGSGGSPWSAFFAVPFSLSQTTLPSCRVRQRGERLASGDSGAIGRDAATGDRQEARQIILVRPNKIIG